MKLFIFAAIIVAMATAEQCPNNRAVCAWQDQEGVNCDCIGTSCTKDSAHSINAAGSTLYTCQEISAFRECVGSEAALNSDFSQMNCRCASGVYTISGTAVVCG
nr:conotoxin precursor Cerm08 [Conus judaeus]UMA83585.1 conotoxin precursor Cerm08 [Conus judaeus]